MIHAFIILLPLLIVNVDAITDNRIKDKGVKHFWGAVLYTLSGFFFWFICHLVRPDIHWWHYAALMLLTRAAFFDIILNEKMNQNWLYEGDITKEKRKFSVIDRIEKWSGLSIFWLRVSYILIYAGYITYYLIDVI